MKHMKVTKKNYKLNKLVIVTVIVCVIAVISVNCIYAYYTNKDEKVNKFKIGNIEVTITEPKYEHNAAIKPTVIKPGETIEKDPTLSNTGTVSAYIRAQVYVPICTIKCVDEDENIVQNESGTELYTYELNSGWEEVIEEGFSGVYEDEEGNRFKVYTYKFIENGVEKAISAGETISTPVFSNVTVVNYLDQDKEMNTKLHICALGVQSEGGNADEMWISYKNQNETGILGIEGRAL